VIVHEAINALLMAKKNRNVPRSREDLLAAAKHIVHDYSTLVLTGVAIAKGSISAPFNGPLEQSFHISCRKFAHFFENKRSKRGLRDMMARQFVGRGVKFKFPTWTKWAQHMDKHLFHLSYDRFKNKRPWHGYAENPAFLREFQIAWKLFLSELPQGLKERFSLELNDRAQNPAFRDLDLR